MVFKPHFISTDTYKLKVEKTIKGVLGRSGGGAKSVVQTIGTRALDSLS